MSTTRLSIDEYMLGIARAVSARATCPRLAVGSVIQRDGHLLSTGFNGSPRGILHCTEVGCDLVNNHCSRACHAEANAITQAARHGVSVLGATLVVTASPCLQCMKMIINSGIVRVVYGERYRSDPKVDALAHVAGVGLFQLKESTCS